MAVSARIREYLNQSGIPLQSISEGTGISASLLQESLIGAQRRELTADEFLRICSFLNKDPYEFTGGNER